jgi:hypothetical protein
MLFDQTKRAAKGGSLKLDLLLNMEMRAGGIRQFMLAIDRGGGGDPNAQQQHKKRRPKANPSYSAHPASKFHLSQSRRPKANVTI